MKQPEQRPAVLVMAKVACPGRVKTRLAPLLGDSNCARLQAVLTQRAVELACSVVPASSTFIALEAGGTNTEQLVASLGRASLDVERATSGGGGAGSDMERRLPPGVRVFPQEGGHLGQRMAGATKAVLRTGQRPVLVIGTDVPMLSPAHLRRALGLLVEHDVVFGPAVDGGYYLVGMASWAPGVFAIAPQLWGGPSVLEASLRQAEACGYRACLLGELRDLDTPADAQAHLLEPDLPLEVREVLAR